MQRNTVSAMLLALGGTVLAELWCLDGVRAQTSVTPAAVGIPGVPWSQTLDRQTNLPVQNLGAGRWSVGQVVLDTKSRTIAFPAAVNMDRAAVEYLLVAEGGKTHESILKTGAKPFDIHVAMLLLGARAATTSNPAIFYDPTQSIPGDTIEVELAWRDGNSEVASPAASWIFNSETERPMSQGPWAYNGSQFVEGEFVAQQEGSIASVMTDPNALINNPRSGRENDAIWHVRSNTVPPVGTSVEVRIRLLKAKGP